MEQQDGVCLLSVLLTICNHWWSLEVVYSKNEYWYSRVVSFQAVVFQLDFSPQLLKKPQLSGQGVRQGEMRESKVQKIQNPKSVIKVQVSRWFGWFCGGKGLEKIAGA